MTKRFIFFLLAASTILKLQAQSIEKYGTSYYDAIPVVFSSGKTTFSDIRDTSTYPPYYYQCRYIPRDNSGYKYTQGKGVHYRIETLAPGDLIIHNWNSIGVGFTTLFILRPARDDEEGEWPEGDIPLIRVATFEECDFLSPDYHPEELGIPEGVSDGRASLRLRNLPSGTYHIIAAGYKYSNASVRNGLVGTTIIADLSSTIPDEPETTPEDPNNCPIQYQYDSSGNRIKTIKKQ